MPSYEETELPSAREDPARVGSFAEPLLSFAGTLHIPGTLHILHNASRDMTGVLQCFAEVKQDFKAIAAVLAKQCYRNIVVSLCFAHRSSCFSPV